MLIFSEEYLIHHGIAGQKWGVRNGPPYPLGDKPHNASFRTSIGKTSAHRTLNKNGYDGIVSLAIGVAAATATAAAIQAIDNRRDAETRAKIKESKGQDLHRQQKQESLETSLTVSNPTHETRNCANCAIAGVLRMQGYDVSARTRSGKAASGFGNFIKTAFKEADVRYMSSKNRKDFVSSPDNAAAYLKKEFGDNAAGVIGVQWRNRSAGHAFSWRIQNGKVEFLDFQSGKGDNTTRNYWPRIDAGKNIIYSRLDDKEPNTDVIYEVLQNGTHA